MATTIKNPPNNLQPTPVSHKAQTIFCTAMVLIFALSFCGMPFKAARAQSVCPIKASADLYNFDQIHPYLLRGGAPSPAGLHELKNLGVKTIIDFRLNPVSVAKEAQIAKSLGINYINLPTKFFPSASTTQTFFTVCDGAASDAGQAPIFIHCSHGSDRTGFITAMFRITRDGWSIADASIEMLSHGFLVHRLPIVGEPKEVF